MPAIDNCQPAVISALKKAGWEVIDDPYSLRIGYYGRRIFADLRLQNRLDGKQLIVVEIKCFPERANQLSEFYQALGQYFVYRTALILAELDANTLHLAVPQNVFEDFFQQNLIQATLNDAKMKLIVIDLLHEEIVLWQP